MHTYRIDPPGACLAYHDFPGEEPVCLFLHGLGASSSADFPEIAAFPALRRYRSILVDFFGFGFSQRPYGFSYSLDAHAQTIVSLLKHLEISHRSCVLIGHSMGGAVAITIAAITSSPFAGLVIAEGNLDPGGGFVSRPISAQRETEFVERGYAEFLRILDNRPHVSDYAASVRAADPLALHRSAVSLKAGTTPTMRERFVTLQVPRTYLFGEKSLPNPDEQSLPRHGLTVDIIPAASHNMMHDNPTGFVNAVARAIARCQDTGAGR